MILRAGDAPHARRLAARAYGIAANHMHGEEVSTNPWTKPEYVAAVQVQAAESFSEGGDAGVVFPPDAVAAVSIRLSLQPASHLVQISGTRRADISPKYRIRAPAQQPEPTNAPYPIPGHR